MSQSGPMLLPVSFRPRPTGAEWVNTAVDRGEATLLDSNVAKDLVLKVGAQVCPVLAAGGRVPPPPGPGEWGKVQQDPGSAVRAPLPPGPGPTGGAAAQRGPGPGAGERLPGRGGQNGPGSRPASTTEKGGTVFPPSNCNCSR